LRRSPGWNSFSASAARYHNQLTIFCGSRILAARQLRLAVSCTGSTQLQKGRARPVVPELAIQVKNVSQPTTGAIQRSVDIDLGWKDFAATSDGEVITA